MVAVCKAVGRPVTPKEALGVLAAHFILANQKATQERKNLRYRVLERDNWKCTAPGCSKEACHVHHIVYRSAKGPDTMENLTSMCAAHHLHGEHYGYIKVTGMAPDKLKWKLGL